MQLALAPVRISKQVLLQTQPANNPIYTGPLDAVSKVIKAEGMGGLYKGVTSPLAGQMFFRATLFFGYARAKEIVGVSPDDPLSYCRAGMLAWAAGSMFESPIDFFKSQWQSQIIKVGRCRVETKTLTRSFESARCKTLNL